ncbi:hypothetical protein OU798_21580 [Prolixibacteraceae bacterium Z1-6]|uniref:Uncharacterized protein n=1 Tax=Draconibacterium aestuarii TaxID=2998507 RepID=A0A9X3J7Y5_9BACT|nr:hypothetical protein [Prolixibacteraceae bacterium Z1-6]
MEWNLILSFLREGTKEKPKFEPDNLEYQSSGNHLKENPEVLSRLGQQAGSDETKVSAAKLHNTKEATPRCRLERGIS